MLKPGAEVPEYKGISPAGDSISLSNLLRQEKIVFVNFWAAWCSDCLKHNPELVELNQLLKGKKFDGHEVAMVSISLDKDTSLWKRRILQQGLDWENHITDMQGWESEQLKQFGVRVIPANYLVEHTGKIIAADVKNENVIKILEKKYSR